MLIVPLSSHPKVQKLTEDEVTSTVFGPLNFMSPRGAWEALLYSGLVKGFGRDFPLRHHELISGSTILYRIEEQHRVVKLLTRFFVLISVRVVNCGWFSKSNGTPHKAVTMTMETAPNWRFSGMQRLLLQD